MEREYLYKCLRCGLPIHRVKVRVGRGGDNPQPPHWEVGWRHVEVVVAGKKARCLRAVPPSGDVAPKAKVRGVRGKYLKTYSRRKRGWEKGKNPIVISYPTSETQDGVGYSL